MFGSMRIVLVFSGLLLGSSVALAQDRDDEGVVQTRGPIHEAFAQPLQPAPQAGPVIRRKPPEAVPELPAEQKPDGDVVWIPGYWSWDEERGDFIWVSGFWRQPPAGRRWIPGYWAEADNGWQWVPGFWAPAEQQEVPYQPAPPQSLDYGPVAPSPGDNYVYSPGYWVYRQRYYWRPGSWIVPQNGNVWVPPSYSWTPNGCVFVDGYWDYPLEDRGLLFAPVAFDNSFGYSPGWCYRPNYAVGIAGLLASLFVRPGWNQYCYGDYYGSNYYNAGYRPWFGSGGYDPLYSYYNWSNRGDPGWRRGNRDLYAARNNGSAARPPRTLAQQNTSIRNNNVTQNNVNNGTIDGSNNLQMATPLNQLARTQGTRGRGLTSLSAAQLQEQRRTAQRLQEVARQRTQVERVAASGGLNRNVGQARSLSLPPLASTASTALTAPASAPAKSTPPSVGKSPVQSPAVPRTQNPDPQRTPSLAAPQRAENPIARPNQNAAPKLSAPQKSSPPVQAPAGSLAPQAAPRAPQPQPFRQITPPALPRVSPPQQPARSAAPQAAPRSSAPVQRPAAAPRAAAPPRVSAPSRPAPAPRMSAAPQRSSPPAQRGGGGGGGNRQPSGKKK